MSSKTHPIIWKQNSICLSLRNFFPLGSPSDQFVQEPSYRWREPIRAKTVPLAHDGDNDVLTDWVRVLTVLLNYSVNAWKLIPENWCILNYSFWKIEQNSCKICYSSFKFTETNNSRYDLRKWSVDLINHDFRSRLLWFRQSKRENNRIFSCAKKIIISEQLMSHMKLHEKQCFIIILRLFVAATEHSLNVFKSIYDK